MLKENDFAYDEMAYPSFVHSQTHPDRLATIATLLGLKPQLTEKCRVLELGCGDGTNIIAFANGLPESEFVGIDLSQKQVEYGNSIIDSIGLKNLKLLNANILDLNRAEFGEFDYIIAHGVYSWTPEKVRDKVLAICREMLTEQGIAFVSYNTLPGFHSREMVREIVIYHTRNINEPQEKIDQALGFLEFLSKSVNEPVLYKNLLTYEFQDIIKSSPQVIFHDALEKDNTPVYFHQFMSHAEKHNLQFLSEVEYFTKKDAQFNSEIRETLEKFGDDLISREQYIDFFSNRRFRQTLLCRKELQISNEPQVEFIKDLRISGGFSAKSENCSLAPKTVETFIGNNDTQFQIDHSLTKAALVSLGKIMPHSINFQELVQKSQKLIEEKLSEKVDITENDEKILAEVLLQIYNVGLVTFCVQEPSFADIPGEKPLVSRYIKWQIENGFENITTLRFENLSIQDELARKILVLFDGTRTREDVLRELEKHTEFENEEEKENFSNNLPETLDEHLNRMSEFGIFVK